MNCLGNWDTLEVRPKERGLDTRNELIKFYEANYSANLMHLVVYTNGTRSFLVSDASVAVLEITLNTIIYSRIFLESLDKIQNLVEEKFSDIRNTDRSYFRSPGQPCKSNHLQV